MNRTYEYRVLPQRGQLADLDRLLWMTRGLYNAALQERIECYNKTGKGVTLYDQMKSLTAIRADDADWRAVSVLVARGALKTLDRAYQAFFRRVKAGEKPGFPRFKGRNRWRSIHLAEQYGLNKGCGKWMWLTFKGMRGRIRVWFHRPLPEGAVQKEARLVKDGKGWKLCLMLELPDVAPVEAKGAIGIDVGLAHFLTTDEGEHIPNPRFLQRQLKTLRREQRSLARKVRGSGNRERQRQVVARVHQRVKSARSTFHWSVASKLVKRQKTLIVEDLNIKGLAKSRLSRQVADVGWAGFIERLVSKAECAGLQVMRVDPKHTSQLCSGCGEMVRKSLAVRVHSCPSCGLTLDRDHNAAVNIKKRAVACPSVHNPGVALGGLEMPKTQGKQCFAV